MRILRRNLQQLASLSSVALKKSAHNSKRLLFSKYLLATNTVISVCSSGLGDALQQRYEIICKRQASYNRTRTGKLALTGVPCGIACHYWYVYLDKWFVQRTLKNIGKKIILDQLIFSPILIALFLVTFGNLERKSSQTISSDFFQKGVKLYTAEWIIWPPAQLFNFWFLPTKYRVLYDNAISLGFDCYYPYVCHKKSETEPSVEQIKDRGQENESESSWSPLILSHRHIHYMSLFQSFS